MLLKIYITGYFVTSTIPLLDNLTAGHPLILFCYKLFGDETYAIMWPLYWAVVFMF